jgi:NAD(P)-dependent dehydrogenase (short-subunit alcohol dehydrogenase family)
LPKALEGKAAVVTGAGRGIGRVVALLLAELGARVVVNDPGVDPTGTGQDSAPAAQVVQEIRSKGGEAVANFDSVAGMEGGEKIIKTALDAWGRLDILVNNAGILRDRLITNMSEEDWDAVIAVHLKGTFACTKAAAGQMRRQRSGRIINTSSSSGLIGNAGQANYGAAKSGVAGFTRVIARDLGRYGVTCNAIAPRALTRMTGDLGGAAAGALSASEFAEMPPDYVAPMTCFLATDDAWNINGQIFLVYGGTVSLLAHPTPYRTIFKPGDGQWTLDELADMVPGVMAGIANPAPPPEDLQIPGRSQAESQAAS